MAFLLELEASVDMNTVTHTCAEGTDPKFREYLDVCSLSCRSGYQPSGGITSLVLTCLYETNDKSVYFGKLRYWSQSAGHPGSFACQRMECTVGFMWYG